MKYFTKLVKNDKKCTVFSKYCAFLYGVMQFNPNNFRKRYDNILVKKENQIMKELEYKKFIKRYEKFQKNNLPTPFWDDERQTLEYIRFSDGNKDLEVDYSITEALGDIVFTGFYYPFTNRHMQGQKVNGKYVWKSVIEHNHAHSFEEVVRALYASPESFHIKKEEKEFYSKQELFYLNRVQKYLLFLGMKDIKTKKAPESRYCNKNYRKYENAFIYQFGDKTLKQILSGKRNFRLIPWYPEHEERKFGPKEYQALIVDQDNNFRMFVEFTHEEVKTYQEIKRIYQNDEAKDDDKFIASYFKILEIFEEKSVSHE